MTEKFDNDLLNPEHATYVLVSDKENVCFYFPLSLFTGKIT